MGYRSDVVAAFYATKDKGAAVKLYVDENFPEKLKGQLRPIDNGRYVGYLFEDPDVKWYPSYPEVLAFNIFASNFLELAEQEEIAWAYEFVRIGEDSGDIEETQSDYADNQVRSVRSIETDF
jgi:hypothetical protein